MSIPRAEARRQVAAENRQVGRSTRTSLDAPLQCLKHASADRLSFAPDCGLSQTARWASKLKLNNMVAGVKLVRKELGL